MATHSSHQQLQYKALSTITPYFNNPRKNEGAIAKVAESIQAFGFQQPIVLDAENTIIVGHTRYLAALELGLETVPCLIADLDEAQARAYRIADNRTNEYAEWDFEKLALELEQLESADFETDWFDFPALNTTPSNPEEEWVGMPDFDPVEKPPQLIISFPDEAARKHFSQHFEGEITRRSIQTWSAWWPEKVGCREDRSKKYEEHE